mmetsp:Transcript_92903/g.262362  ORF Transcript_92903/g.262362 Transcript_92903/m.262362 type:complete len:226 (+) Transcript_92903:443-1120(+)
MSWLGQARVRKRWPLPLSQGLRLRSAKVLGARPRAGAAFPSVACKLRTASRHLRTRRRRTSTRRLRVRSRPQQGWPSLGRSWRRVALKRPRVTRRDGRREPMPRSTRPARSRRAHRRHASWSGRARRQWPRLRRRSLSKARLQDTTTMGRPRRPVPSPWISGVPRQPPMAQGVMCSEATCRRSKTRNIPRTHASSWRLRDGHRPPPAICSDATAQTTNPFWGVAS